MENDHINMQQGIECMIVICTSYIKNKMNVFEYGRRRISETLRNYKYLTNNNCRIVV